LKHGANTTVRETNQDRTLLQISIANGNEKCAQLLINQPSIDKNAQDKEGNTALMLACKTNQLNIVKLLLANHVAINLKNQQNETALKIASQNESNSSGQQASSCEIVIELLKYSSSLSQENLMRSVSSKLDQIDDQMSSKNEMLVSFHRASASIDSFRSDLNNKSTTITPCLSTYQSSYDFSNHNADFSCMPSNIKPDKGNLDKFGRFLPYILAIQIIQLEISLDANLLFRFFFN
jgi:ankyrin repeat protein